MVKRTNFRELAKILWLIEKKKHPSFWINIRRAEKIYSTDKDESNYINKTDHYYVGKATFVKANKLKEFNIISLKKEIDVGVAKVSLKEVMSEEIQKLSNYKEWLNDEKEKVYIILPSLDIGEAFAQIGDLYDESLDLFFTENCQKDPQILLVDQSIYVPALGSEPRFVQSYNGHTIKMAPTGTGKSTIALLVGSVPYKNETEAGLFGANNEDYTGQQRGLLEGDGVFTFDELNTEETPIIAKTLTYMEQGEVERGLKIPVRCRGTKTIVINGNPGSESETLYNNFREEIIAIAGEESPKRFGRRIGHLILGKGDDYKLVDFSKAITRYSPILMEIFRIAIEESKEKIERIEQSLKKFINRENKEYISNVSQLAAKIPDRIVREFIEGFAIGSSKRVNMSSVRYAILINLNKIILKGVNKTLISKIEEDAINICPSLEKINLDSIERLLPPALQMSALAPKDRFKRVLAKYQKRSLREYSKMLGVSHQTIKNWMKELEK